jgi:menaquinol-cytochrome c reductase iron-sulfur subunit
VEPPSGDEHPHLPAPTLWPVGFAVGIACILVGLIVNPLVIVPIGVVITLVFGFLWARDATREYRGEPEEIEPERRAPAAVAPTEEVPEEEAAERFPRNRFLEGVTLGLAALIGGLVTIPILGPLLANPFRRPSHKGIDLGPLSDFPENQFVVSTFFLDPAQGEVTRRTAYIRNNGLADGVPSFTILSNRCAHLGCPVQPNGPVFAGQKKTRHTVTGPVILTPALPAGGFGCPCHGGQYDQEGTRVAGPPVRSLDRYQYSIVHGRLVLGKTYTVAKVEGTGANAQITTYPLANPGDHVDGPEAWLYPLQPPQ